jgi:Domain of unknown function (DUF4360)
MKSATARSLAVAVIAPVLIAVQISQADAAPADFAVPPPAGASITVESMSGTGCKEGSYLVTPSPGNRGVVIAFQKFAASGRGVSAIKDCTLNLSVNRPPGFTMAMTDVLLAGSLTLQEGAEATLTTLSHAQGETEQGQTTKTFSSGDSPDWSAVQVPDRDAFAPCNPDNNIYSLYNRIQVTQGSTTDSTIMDVKVLSLSLSSFTWKRCRPTA